MSFYKTDKSKCGAVAEVDLKSLKRVDFYKTFIPEYCKDKIVLSIGCVDMIDVIDINELIENNNHQLYNINKFAKRTVGIDINKKGIEQLRDLGFDDVYYFDVFDDNCNNPVKDIEFDVLVVSHVIEHVPNCWEFMKNIIEKFKFKEIVVAVPNAHHYNSIFYDLILKQREIGYNDHFYTFTPFNLMRFLESLDIEVDSVMHDYIVPKVTFGKKYKIRGLIKRLVINLAFNKFKIGYGNLICIGKIKIKDI